MLKNLDEIKERYLKEPVDKRLGHLASDLVRVSSFLDSPENMKAADGVLEESKFFIEWTAFETSFDIQELLSEIQPKLALWQLQLRSNRNNSEKTKELKAAANDWGMKILKLSGLVKI